MSTTSALEALLAQCRQPDGPVIIEAPILSAAEAGHLVAALAKDNIYARIIDGTHLASKADLLHALAQAFNFPGYFGHNWDALIDCWSDLSWLKAKGCVCILLSAEAFHSALADVHDTLLTVCEDVARRWHERDPHYVFKLVRGGRP